MATIGDKSVTVNISNASGLNVDGFFRRAGSNDVEAVGGTRFGDGSLTISGLANRTAYRIWAQAKDASGCYSPASRVLLLTPG